MKSQHKRNAWISTGVLIAAAGMAHAGERAAGPIVESSAQHRFSIPVERVRPQRVEPQRHTIAVERVRPMRVVEVIAVSAVAYTPSASPMKEDPTPPSPAPAPSNRSVPFDRSALVPTGSRWADEQEAQKISQPLSHAASAPSAGEAIPMQPVGTLTPVATPVVVAECSEQRLREERAVLVRETSSEAMMAGEPSTLHVCDAEQVASRLTAADASTSSTVGQMDVIPMVTIGIEPVQTTSIERTVPVTRLASELLPPLDSQPQRSWTSPQGWSLVATPLPTGEPVVAASVTEPSATSVVTAAPVHSVSDTPGQMVRVYTESELAEAVQPDVATTLFAQALPSEPVTAPVFAEAASSVEAEIAQMFAIEVAEPVRESAVQTQTSVTTADMMPKMEEVEWFVKHYSAQARSDQPAESVSTQAVASDASLSTPLPTEPAQAVVLGEPSEWIVMGQMTLVEEPVTTAAPVATQAEPVIVAASPVAVPEPVVVPAPLEEPETTLQTPTMTVVGTMVEVEPAPGGQAQPAPAAVTASVTTTPSAMTVRSSTRSMEEARTDAVLATLRRQAVTEDAYEDAQRRLQLRRELTSSPPASEMTLVVGDALGRQIARTAGYLD